jgi:hypothetical protein
VEIIIPQIIINTNEIINITVTNILAKLHINTGNAVSHVTLVSSGLLYALSDSIHLPINGILVLSSVPQHTHCLSQGSQTFFIFFVHLGHEHIQKELTVHHLGQSPISPPEHKLFATAWSQVVAQSSL